ncbi:RHS repeat protein, partial [Isoptericola sp. BMS4]|uniref:RHS repeat protein n=1 Tax=Isoptericola sp. BMS4 TaxID=2527875 RepID=UPI001422640A
MSAQELQERKSWTADERRAHGEKLLGEFEDVARISSVSEDSGDRSDDATDAPSWSPGKVSWPEPAEAGLDVAATARRADVGGLPVSVKSSGLSEGRAKQSSKGSTKAADHETRKIQVEVLRQDEARALGIEGVLLRVSDASATTGASAEASRGRAADGQATQVAPVRGVDLSVDYSTIADAFGGGWSDRLRLVEIPECQLTGADDAGTSMTGDCEPAKPLASMNDPESQTLSATLAEPSSTMLAMTADESGSSGDWSATSLSPSASWDVSTNTGNFSWSYPMRVPPAPAGPEPELALGYSSGSLDGRVASTNNQSSWIGDGWDMSPGFIERRYVPCLDDRKDVDGKSANNASHPSGDLCWDSDNATMTFDGSAVELVKDASTGNWLPKHDDATRVQHLTGGQNADDNGEYWKVTTADGTQYFFGRGQRSASDSTKLNSAWTVPVFGNHAGEPCHASSFGSSSCTQAWRWNLDYVVDTSGNTMTYTYGTETNRYGRNNNTSSVQYVRGGWLKNITYGQRKGVETSSKAPVRVDFSVSERCLKTSTQSCSSLTDSTASAWPDVPADLICTSTSSCADVTAPVFFTRKRLTTVTTKVLDSGSYRAVDAWTLQHTFPDPGDSEDPVLWLDKITHSGKAGGTTTLPAVDFDGEQMANRVDESGTFMPMNRLRLTEIRSESGALTTLTYSPQDCTVSDLPADPATNTRRCFPVRWTPEGATEPVTEYFHKYLVTGIAEDPRGSDPEQVVTTYRYVGGAAWRYDDDPLVAKKDRTWGQFRGYATVDVTEGETGSSTPGRTRFRYFRGMDGDQNGSGGTRSVAVDGVTDHDEFAGMLREEITYNGTGSSVVEKVTSTPWRSGVQATDADGRKSYQAAVQTVVTTTTAPKLAGGERETYVKNYFDSHGQVYKVLDLGDRDKTGDELCTNRYRVSNTSKNIIGAVKREEVLSVGCWGDISRPADVVSDERYSFDGQSFGATPTKGLVTRTEQAKKYSSGSPVYVATERTVYDALGRATSVTDALGRTSTTAYTPASGGPVTKVTSTTPDPDGSGSASSHTTVTELDPAWGAPETVTDPNGKVTTATYDALGRITKVWKPGRVQGEETPHLQYTYTVRSNGHNAVTTKTLDANNNYRTSVSIYDGLLRDRQTQVPGANRDIGGRVVSDTKYDSRGLVAYTYDTWATTGDPSTYAVLPSEAVPTRTRFVRDGAGRVTAEVFEVNEDERWRTTTTYLGDRTVVDPPAGGTPTSTITDARGRTTTLRQFTGSAPTGDHQDTTYSYDQDGNLAEVTDAAGNEWTYTYDMRGRLVEAHDPDKGTTMSTFDDAGQVLTTTDARGKTLAYTYDDLGRTTERRSGSVSGALLASWTYDTVAKGQVSSSTRYSGGDAYTTSVTGYDDAYHPSGQTVTLPASEGELAGSYTSQFFYADSGDYRGARLPALGNLFAEDVVTHYDEAGMPEWLDGGGGVGVYVATTRYTSQGQVEQMDLGTTRSFLVANDWDEGTRRLMKTSLDLEGVSGTDLAASFSYDAAGNVVKVDNRPTADGAPAADTQCFDYDGLRRLTSVWTPAGGSCATA